ncbi:MAG: large conductance mechanosensitive channel protein MscL [Clostridia bacterium]|nr:large conductance mechanosensitive channel protein MscL [Clostridia bacterium]
MKKPKFKLLKEFKDFITKGNVVDLAVGMIIGAAFTAIVTALVNNIFKPLIDSIPIGDGVNGLITMLVGKNADGVVVYNYGWVNGIQEIDLTQSVYINWGAFIMAIINFLLVAAVLFAIIKVINTLKAAGEKAKLEAEKLVKKSEEAPAEEAAVEEAPAEEPAPAEPVETTDDLLREIRDLLRAQAKKDEE